MTGTLRIILYVYVIIYVYERKKYIYTAFQKIRALEMSDHCYMLV